MVDDALFRHVAIIVIVVLIIVIMLLINISVRVLQNLRHNGISLSLCLFVS